MATQPARPQRRRGVLRGRRHRRGRRIRPWAAWDEWQRHLVPRRTIHSSHRAWVYGIRYARYLAQCVVAAPHCCYTTCPWLSRYPLQSRAGGSLWTSDIATQRAPTVALGWVASRLGRVRGGA